MDCLPQELVKSQTALENLYQASRFLAVVQSMDCNGDGWFKVHVGKMVIASS
jgi:hypothetical protein